MTTFALVDSTQGKATKYTLLLLLIITRFCGCATPTTIVRTTNQQDTQSSDHISKTMNVETHISEVIGSGRLTLIFFTPVELCQIRYCLQPEQVAKELAIHYPKQVNLVVVPVYAIDVPAKPQFPLVDLGIYLVEPYVHWLPELAQTTVGWGIVAPELVLVDDAGMVLYRMQETFDVAALGPFMRS